VRVILRGIPPSDVALARRAMKAAARPYRVPAGTEVTLTFVDDAEMRTLNKRFRRKDRTTDVLSFGEDLPRGAKGSAAAARLRAGPDGMIQLGDVVISGPQAARQARRRRWPLASEVAFLAAHGTLHLLGFDDSTTAGYREMLALGTAALAVSSQRPGGLAAPRQSRVKP
jgi:probable rRNA maturation factor